MTTIPESFARFGYTLALVERTLTAVLEDHLAERGTDTGTWYALQVLTMRGPRADRAALTAELATSRKLNAGLAAELLARLEADGLISGGSEVSLTPEGRSLHRDLAEYVAVPRIRLLSQFDPDDIDTTVRTMQAIADRAAEESKPRTGAASR
jgi:hypothetical protein